MEANVRIAFIRFPDSRDTLTASSITTDGAIGR